ncbi:60S ribosomal protein L9-A [Vanrija pseudolonga]|uniref:60S ribosomal protein L9-A n=1 Tax=Vanrija pseudolonga TaxID=143232 RepID=A0AAF1BPK7_9TREE|nr:60S ribosomal protein L9-A [Vanrija pseudolonga]
MKDLSSVETLAIPADVTVKVKARTITVTGPRGTLTKNVGHVAMDIQIVGQKVTFTVWHGGRKHVACLRTIKSAVENMITGVTKGFLYKMKLVYAHFPINAIPAADGASIQIRNFLGEKIVRDCPMLEGVKVSLSDIKDELIIQGNDIEKVSQSAASITDKTRVKEKDIRKFLDGVYISERTNVVQDE